MPDDKPQPLLSQAGNPFPPQLTPVFVDMTPVNGVPLERMWPRPLKEEDGLQDHEGCVTTSEYLYETIEPYWPRFKLRLCPRTDETDAQYAAYRRDIEHHTLVHSVYLGTMQQICTALGNHKGCARRACRRRGRCCGRRDEDRYAISFAIFPPCVPIDIEIIETYRMAVVEFLTEVVRQSPERKGTAMAE
jgi:hypothetical protein